MPKRQTTSKEVFFLGAKFCINTNIRRLIMDLGKLIGTVTKIANDSNTKKAMDGTKDMVSKIKKKKPGEAVPAVKPSAEKQILSLAETTNPLSLKQIVSQTSLEVNEADEAVKNLVAKGMAAEQVGPDGKKTYDFS
jgi:hypothetical protein